MLTDEQLLSRLTRLCRTSRKVDIAVILLLIQVEDRRIDLRAACPSLYDFCRRKLGMSEGTTHRRIEAVRLVRRIPALIPHLQSGALTLSALAQLRDHFTAENHETVIAAATGKSSKQIAELVARMAPRPDVPARLQQMPSRREAQPVSPPASTASTPTGESSLEDAATTAAPTYRSEKRPRLEPTGHARWKLQLTADQALHDKLERAQTLLRYTNPTGDLVFVVDAALDALLHHLEGTRRATVVRKPRRPREKAAQNIWKHGRISRSTRRALFERDGERCTFEDASGERCPATTLLEVDHIEPRARGGSGELDNLRVRCRAHNRLHAEEDFGREYIARKIRERSAPPTSTMEVEAAVDQHAEAKVDSHHEEAESSAPRRPRRRRPFG